ncbi:MAG: ABC transporter permease [Planctomycetes bacterium]|nr:ABC transporter permease [Planctomycetota bacterium]
MRWHIIRTLFGKEVRRQLANRGGLALAALLVVAALLLSVFGNDGGPSASMIGDVESCYVDYWRDDGWVQHLRANVPPELKRNVTFRDVNHLSDRQLPGGRLVYPRSSGAIQMRMIQGDDGRIRRRICVWQPRVGDMSPYETWFWRESARYFQQQSCRNTPLAPDGRGVGGEGDVRDSELYSNIEHEHARLEAGVDMRASITSGLILFALFFSCVYLMPSLMCEERERGILLAQALSPASPQEILAAKFLFYPPAGMALAAILAGVAKPAVLADPIFWLVLTVAAFGSLGIGLTIASIARSQRTASMTALCYMLVVALLQFICRLGNIPLLPYLALEYHCPRLLHAVLTDSFQFYYIFNVAMAALLSIAWAVAATVLFRKCGWQ